MNRFIKNTGLIMLICTVLFTLTGCAADVPKYWQDRCEPVDFHTDFCEYNLSWDEIKETSKVFTYVPEFNTDENCLYLDSVYHKANEEPKQTAEKYIDILEQQGFTTEKDNYKNKFYKYGYCCTKLICEEFNGHPVKVMVTIRYNDYEFKEQYNLCVNYAFSDYQYEKYLEEQESGSVEVAE